MDFKLDIKITNLGKLKKAEVRINRFTLFAGLNNTGKSYVSKFLYSLLDSLNADFRAIYLDRLSKEVRQGLDDDRIEFLVLIIGKGKKSRRLIRKVLDESKELRNTMRLSRLQGLAKANLEDSLDELINKNVLPLQQSLAKLKQGLDAAIAESKSKRRSKDSSMDRYSDSLSRALKLCDEIINYRDAYAKERNIKRAYESRLRHNLMHNFQVSSPAKLIRAKADKLQVEVSIPGEAKINKVTCTIFANGKVSLDYPVQSGIFSLLHDFTRVLYLESPIYLKLDFPLELANSYIGDFYTTDKKEDMLTGVPKYYVDLEKAMRGTRTGEPQIKFSIEKIVGGRIIRDSSNQLVYKENKTKQEHPLTSTAMGVIQFAFIAYLVEAQVIKKNSVIFIDEPEAHLHPKWQREMMRAIRRLIRQGVNLVLATHSPDMVQWVQSEMYQNNDFEDALALNHFTADGKFQAAPPREVCSGILADLTDSLAKEYIRSLT